MGDLLLGLDIGTQGVKGVLVNREGDVIASATRSNRSIIPRTDWCEQDVLTNWWVNPVKVIELLLSAPKVHASRVAAVSISGIYPVLGPADSRGMPLRPAILYSDNRALNEVFELNEKLGLDLTSESLTPKLLWFIRNEPELFNRMDMFFDSAHYAVYRLTGEYVIDTITPGLFGAIYSSPNTNWREDICEEFGIPVGKLPSVHPPAAIVGEVHAEASEETGLDRGTPVLTGLPDLVASSLSVGVVNTDESIIYYGTAGVMPVMKSPMIENMRIPFPEEERLGKRPAERENQITGDSGISGFIYDYPAYCLSVGEGVRWFCDNFGSIEKEAAAREGGATAYTRLDRGAQNISPGSNGLFLLPHLQGQRSPSFNPWATGVFFGVSASHTRFHFFRAVLESYGYEIRRGLEAFYSQMPRLTRVVATGGGARSGLWRQIVSSITGLTQEYIPESNGSLGAAYLAGLALGWFENFDDLRDNWISVSAVTEPDPEYLPLYDQLFPVYKALSNNVKSIYRGHYDVVRGIAAHGNAV